MLECAAAAAPAAAATAAPAVADVTRCPGTTQRGMSAGIGPDTAATVPVAPPAPANETAAAAVPGERLAKWGPALASPASAFPAVHSNAAAAVAADDRGRVEVADAPAAISSITTCDRLGVAMRRMDAAVGRRPAVPYAGDSVLADPAAAACRRLAIGRCVAASTEVADTAIAVKLAVGERITAATTTSIMKQMIVSMINGAMEAVGSLICATAATTVRGRGGGAVARAAQDLGRHPGVRRQAEGEIG
jgi:hypothetical protein